MLPCSAIIEISPYQMWCPIYQRLLTNLGHFHFPIFSRLKGPLLDWTYVSGPKVSQEDRVKLWRMCERSSLPEAATATCWHEAKHAAVYVPIHEFEHTLIRAMDLIGIRVHPAPGALFDAVDGLATIGVADIASMDYRPGWYESQRATVCVPAEGGRCYIGGPLSGADGYSAAAAAKFSKEFGATAAAAMHEALSHLPPPPPMPTARAAPLPMDKAEAAQLFDDAQVGDAVEEELPEEPSPSPLPVLRPEAGSHTARTGGAVEPQTAKVASVFDFMRRKATTSGTAVPPGVSSPVSTSRIASQNGAARQEHSGTGEGAGGAPNSRLRSVPAKAG